MSILELKPAWCGSIYDGPRFSNVRGMVWIAGIPARAYCSRECLDFKRRAGWHQKPVTLTSVDSGDSLVHLDRADLDKERAEGRAERNRLARKVNALLDKLMAERYAAAHANSQLIDLRENVERAELLRDSLRMETEALRKALEDLGQKNDALAMEMAELSGDLEDSRRWNDEARFEHDRELVDLLGRLVASFRKAAILEGFVFEVLDQYAESQQQLASNR